MISFRLSSIVHSPVPLQAPQGSAGFDRSPVEGHDLALYTMVLKNPGTFFHDLSGIPFCPRTPTEEQYFYHLSPPHTSTSR